MVFTLVEIKRIELTMRLIYLGVILFSFLGCKSLKSENKETVFSKAEQDQLESILSFFDKKVCKAVNLKRRDLNSCYATYLDHLTLIAETGKFDIGISLEEQDSFFNTMDQKLLNEIFIEGELFLNRKRWVNQQPEIFPDTITQYFFNTKGKYLQHLKELGEENIKIQEYHKNILNDPGIPIALFNEVLMGYRYYDITNDDIRLMLSLHYLLLNKKEMGIKKSEARLDEIISK